MGSENSLFVEHTSHLKRPSKKGPIMAEQKWLPIESNPTVMNQFLHNLGMPKSWAMTDVYGLDEPLLAMLPQPVVALMLLFPINEKYEEYLKTLKFEKVPDSVYYMKQTISNACGTVAMIHSVANTMEQVNLDNGHLKDFLESTREKSPQERATELEGNAKICEVHDNIAREGQTAAPSLEDNVDYHFIAFVELRQKRHFYRTQLSSARRTWIVIPTISTLL